MKRKIKVHSELVYVVAMLLISFAVAMVASADFGVSMIVAPAYIVSQKFTFLTFGQSEYIVQGIMFIIFCIVMKKVKITYFFSFITCLVYGAILDMWRLIIPMFNPEVTAPGSMAMPLRIVLFVLGMVLTSLAVSLFFKTYLYPQVYDFFVKGITEHYNLKLSKFKTCFDFSLLAIACILTLVFFRKFVGVGIGTLIMTVCNGTIIGFFSKTFDKVFEVVPFSKKAEGFFSI